jgi:SfnB family sulfur acquisition oxidoreductase
MTAPAAATASAHVIVSDAEAIAVARDVAAELLRDSIARDRDRRLPLEEMVLLSASGLLAIGVPRSHGGAGASFATISEVIRILSQADGPIGQLPQNHFLFVEALLEDGSPEQQRFFFAELLAGARFGNAQAERGSSSTLNLGTRLRQDGDAYRLDGTKYYCTGAILADRIPVAAIDDDGRQVLAYVRRDAPGVEVLPDWNAFGQRTTFSGTSHFRGVAVTPLEIVPHWRLFERPNAFHPFGMLLHAAVDVGIARAAFEDMVRLIRARGRPRLGAPVPSAAEDPLLLTRLGELAAELEGLEALLAKAGGLTDAARAAPSQTAIGEAAAAVGAVKAYAEDVGLAIASDLFALSGSSSIDAGLGLDRHWRNLRAHSVHDANQWRYQQAGAWRVNGDAPGRPKRSLLQGAEAAPAGIA